MIGNDSYTQIKRLIWRSGFFALFLLAPVLDIFRFDLNKNHMIFLWHPWTLGIDSSKTGFELVFDMFILFFLPLGLFLWIGFYVSWKWGRLYCGWLCPHFPVVEAINSLMRRASGKLSIWDKEKLPNEQMDGKRIEPNKMWWVVTIVVVILISFVWGAALLTYLLPPKEIYGNLLGGNLTRNQFIFIATTTLLFALEFTAARHLFCRFGCAIGLLQSLIWMANKKAMVVAFDRKSAKLCADCDRSCEHACPMRLKPRSLKRSMFTCTQCMQCVDACEKVQDKKSGAPLLKMLEEHCALDVSDRGFGRKPVVPERCFSSENTGKRHCACNQTQYVPVRERESVDNSKNALG
ncbi:MAG: 4Fe-4S binding protein [gamma proteobacterium endosymbiont of Lamellibrachia anaximandri]|nr:4Fe-4S binding protein [gamma proteobacterium endosymbiont of Lamellibrachia anaximandri]MBL3619265.1 4Fe-4S binding protein [gamma proteobacterium endosymbiont of Lamellibrachia anaximandri]